MGLWCLTEGRVPDGKALVFCGVRNKLKPQNGDRAVDLPTGLPLNSPH